MYLGGGFAGHRLSRLYKESLTETDILKELDQLLTVYAKTRYEEEHFGDFIIRQNIFDEM